MILNQDYRQLDITDSTAQWATDHSSRLCTDAEPWTCRALMDTERLCMCLWTKYSIEPMDPEPKNQRIKEPKNQKTKEPKNQYGPMDLWTYESLDPGTDLLDLGTSFLLQSTYNEYLRQINNELNQKNGLWQIV